MKRVFSFLLVLLLVVGLMPMQVVADDYFGNGDDDFLYVMLVVATEDGEPVGDGYHMIMESAGTKVDIKHYIPAGYKIVYTVVDGDTSPIKVDGNWCFTMPNAPGEVLVIVAPENGGTPQPPQEPTPYNVYVNDSIENGTISVDSNEAYTGDIVTITVDPEPGYKLSWIVVYNIDADGIEYPPVSQGNNIYSFTIKDCDILVDGGFEPVGDSEPAEYTVSLDARTDTSMGSVTFTPSKAEAGETITITTNPKNGCYAMAVSGSTETGNPVYDITKKAEGSYQFKMPAENVKIHVIFKEEVPYNVKVAATQHGTVTADPVKSLQGRAVTVTAAPDEGYTLDTLTVVADNGESLTVNEKNQFFMPASDVTVTATFKAIEYHVKVTTSENGTASTNVSKAKKGDTVTVTTTPADGYELDTLTVKDSANKNVTVIGGTFTMPASDVTVTATFKEVPQLQPGEYPITVKDPENGDASAPVKAKPGDTVTVTTEPDEGFELDQITVIDGDGQPVMVTDGHFTMPESGVTVTVTFKAIEYNVKVTTPENGTLVADLTKAKKGDTVTVNATPAEGYKLIDITVTADNGKEITVGADNTFTMPASDVIVAATIVLDQKIQVSFDPNTNTDSYDIPSSELDPGSSLEDIPSVDRKDYVFLGWFTEDGTPVTPDTVFVEDTTVYGRWAAHTTKPGDNDFNADIAMDDGDVVNMLVTDEDMKSGQDVVVYMTVDEKHASSVPTEDYNAIIEMAGDDRIGAYLDIQLFKQIGTENPFNIHNTKENWVPITVELPDTVIPQNVVTDSFYIIFHHVEDGETVTDTVPATFDVASRILTFSANRFSTYALAYTTYDVSFYANGGSGAMETLSVPAGNYTLPTNGFKAPAGKEFGGWKVGNVIKNPGDQIVISADTTITAVWETKTTVGTLDYVPKTGDSTHLLGWTMMVLCSAAMLAGVALFDKKRAR